MAPTSKRHRGQMGLGPAALFTAEPTAMPVTLPTLRKSQPKTFSASATNGRRGNNNTAVPLPLRDRMAPTEGLEPMTKRDRQYDMLHAWKSDRDERLLVAQSRPCSSLTSIGKHSIPGVVWHSVKGCLTTWGDHEVELASDRDRPPGVPSNQRLGLGGVECLRARSDDNYQTLIQQPEERALRQRLPVLYG